VPINGENFLFTFDGQPQKWGFYVTRVVEAQGHKEAELAAIELVRDDSRLKGGVINERNDPPMLYAEEIEKIKKFDSEKNVDAGFSWYDETES
jgi:hypothetical protein